MSDNFIQDSIAGISKAGFNPSNELVVDESGTKVIKLGLSGLGTATGTGVSVKETSNGVINKSVFTFDTFTITGVDETGVAANATVKFYDLPEGAILFMGATANLALTKSSAGINDDWDGDFGIGTTLAVGATLATTEQNIIPTTATPQASSGATTAKGQSTATQNVVVDGTGTAVDVFLNILIDDADHDIDTTPANVIVNGTITLVWINLGDY